MFCAIRFGDAAAFIHEEQVWRHGLAQGATEWGVLLGRGMTSFDHWKFQLQVIPLVAVLLLGNKRLSAWFTVPLWAFVIFVEHRCWDRDFSFAVILLLGGISMIYFRRQLGVATVTYGFVAVAVLGLAGVPMLVDRILYAVLPFSFAVGLFLERFLVSAAGLLWATAYDLFVSPLLSLKTYGSLKPHAPELPSALRLQASRIALAWLAAASQCLRYSSLAAPQREATVYCTHPYLGYGRVLRSTTIPSTRSNTVYSCLSMSLRKMGSSTYFQRTENCLASYTNHGCQ